MAKKSKTNKPKPRARRERRFEPLASARPSLVYVLGAGGALAMGAGAWGQFGSLFTDAAADPIKAAPYILTLGALLTGGAIWVGTSGEAAIRVGDARHRPGEGRPPPHALVRDREHRVARRGRFASPGADEAGSPMVVSAALKSQPQAATWIVREARARVPAVVNVPGDSTLPEARVDSGESLPLDPPQVVGKHCAASGKAISYEPDARVCPRCERVFHRLHVPEECPCGASLADLRGAPQSA